MLRGGRVILISDLLLSWLDSTIGWASSNRSFIISSVAPAASSLTTVDQSLKTSYLF